MKRSALLIGLALILLPTVMMPETVAARPISDFNVDATTTLPSRRSVRARVRARDIRTADMLSIKGMTLDRTFANSDYGVKIQYSSLWKKMDLLQDNPPLMLVVMFLSPYEESGLRQNINLVVETLPSEMTMAEYTKLGIEQEREFFDGFAMESSQDVLIAGAYRAHRVLFTATVDDAEMSFEQIWILRGKKAHVWTFADDSALFDDHVGIFESMMNTLIVR